MKQIKRKIHKFLSPEIIFILIGFILFIVGIVPFTFEKSKLQRYQADGIYVEGVISDILSYYSGEDKNYDVYVTFKPEGGESITARINFYSSSMYIGKTIGIYYNPQNPYDFVAEGSPSFVLLLAFSGIGLLFFVIGMRRLWSKNMLFNRIFMRTAPINAPQSQIGRIKDKLKKAAQKDSSLSVFGASSHKYIMRQTATAQEIAKWEEAHGAKLPEDYTRFLMEIGNGGAGPYYGIYSLDKATSYSEKEALSYPCVLYPKMEKGQCHCLVEPLISDRDISDEEYNAARSKILGGMLCFGTQGCEYDMYLVLQGPHRGRVVYTSDFHPDHPFFFVYETNFLDWYERWLDELIADYEISWFGTRMAGDEKTLIQVYRKATSNDEKQEALDGLFKFKHLSPTTIGFLKKVADNRENDRNTAIQLICKTSISAANGYLMELLQSPDSEDFLLALKFLNWYGKSAGADRYLEIIRKGFTQFVDPEIMRYVGYICDHYGAVDIQDFVPYLCHTDSKIQADALYATRNCKNKAAHWEIITQLLNAADEKTINSYLSFWGLIPHENLLPCYQSIWPHYKENENFRKKFIDCLRELNLPENYFDRVPD